MALQPRPGLPIAIAQLASARVTSNRAGCPGTRASDVYGIVEHEHVQPRRYEPVP